MKQLRKSVFVLQDKVEKLEKHNDKLYLPFQPEMMIVEKRKEKWLNPFEESQRNMRKLEERLEEAEEEIGRIKAVINLKEDRKKEKESDSEEEDEEKIPPKLDLSTLDLIELNIC